MRIDSLSPNFTVPTTCLICQRPEKDGFTFQVGTFDVVTLRCPQCGEYQVAGEGGVTANVNLSEEVRGGLSCAARQAPDGLPLKITAHNSVELASRHLKPRVADNIHKLLLHIGTRLQRPGGEVDLYIDRDFTVIDCFSPMEFRQYVNWAEKAGFLSASPHYVGPPRPGVNDSGVTVSLTLAGWNQVQPLPQQGGIPGNCFVAMSFGEELRAAYESGIEPAILDAGFKAIRVDRKEHNNEITDEIMAEIRNCQFMVADFTGQRGGVYYEAGFAVGLARPVIWCCRKDEIGKLHFDTNHRNHIDWQTPQELRQRLYRRIRATILEQA